MFQRLRTSDHMFILKTLQDKLSKNRKLYTCFVDFKKAYDSVWRNGMFYKLLNYNIRGFYYDIIKKMYQNTKSMVKCGNKYSQEFDSFTGLKQGDNISPMLFNLYINDLPDIFDNTCDPPKLGIRDVNCLCYADDLVIISESPQGLQQSLNKLQLYCKK